MHNKKVVMKPTRKISARIQNVLLGAAALWSTHQTLAQDGTWTGLAPMPTDRYGLVAGVVNNTFYAVGGFNNEVGLPMERTVEAFDPIANTWTAKASMLTARVYAAGGVVNNTLYVVGGTDFVGRMVASVEAYNPATDSWTPRASMPGARYGQAVAVVNGILYALGGWDGGFTGRVRDLWAYNPATDSWTAKTPMPTARMFLAAAVVDGKLYAIGGELNGNTVVGTVEVYDPATDTWTTRAPMPTQRLGLEAATVNGLIYAVGGATESGFNSTGTFLSTVEVYDPATDTWTTITSMPTPRSFFGCGVINGRLYAAGGTVRNTGLKTMEAFTPAPIKTSVSIEIRPERINPRNRGKLLVAVLSTDSFDAATVDPSTVRFGATGTEAAPVRGALTDFDGDGRLDLVLHFTTQDTGIFCGETSASLTGMTFGGELIEGTDDIRTVGCAEHARPERKPASERTPAHVGDDVRSH